ncbi:hypothetical protein PGTUg99_020869 [Puccinia graminis f. sp. tritici]|uniref:Uncharacterized protein n=1 Tax=Puccinia graminis f. sp. tritici TaxID=56615 RepID=A0A5B0QSH6_PUCGR|nr:hypothetical protein PGTUg99_020869 [Puccinia graminis f. sp. tritici]
MVTLLTPPPVSEHMCPASNRAISSAFDERAELDHFVLSRTTHHSAQSRAFPPPGYSALCSKSTFICDLTGLGPPWSNSDLIITYIIEAVPWIDVIARDTYMQN